MLTEPSPPTPGGDDGKTEAAKIGTQPRPRFETALGEENQLMESGFVE
jgi:hypothetical protein